MRLFREMNLILGLCLVSAVATAQAPGRTTNDATGSVTRPRVNPPGSMGSDVMPATGLPAAPPAGTATAAAPKVSARDRGFFDEASRGGMAEVAMGGLGKDRASSDEVKQFAQRMIDDHSKFGEELTQIGGKLNLSAPKELPRQHRAMIDKLGRLSGASFDKQYMKHMVEDHKKDVEAFRKQADKGDDGALKSFASTKLPTLESHLSQAQQIYDRLK